MVLAGARDAVGTGSKLVDTQFYIFENWFAENRSRFIIKHFRQKLETRFFGQILTKKEIKNRRKLRIEASLRKTKR